MHNWFDSGRLQDGLNKIGISLSPKQEELLRSYGEEVQKMNEVMNLTRVPANEFIERHFLDSLSISSAVELGGIKTLIDIGTGAGFPGVPIAIAWPHIKVTLLDSTRKKINFIKDTALKLGITLNVVHGRAEELSRDKNFKDKFDVAASRAVSSLKNVAEISSPFVSEGGRVVAWKGEKVTFEVKEAEPVLGRLRLDAPNLIRSPILKDSYLVVFRKL